MRQHLSIAGAERFSVQRCPGRLGAPPVRARSATSSGPHSRFAHFGHGWFE